jgi:DNA-3-methyladenine glycosylase
MKRRTPTSDDDSSFSRFFSRQPSKVARDLIGARLEIEGCGGVIVETEAYGHGDPASHSYDGPTNRNRSMFGSPGIAYVYRSYGVHWCLNFVCESETRGSAVLIRALEPTIGLKRMQRRRGIDDVRRLCRGPGNLTKALGIDAALDGHPLHLPPFSLVLHEGSRLPIVTGPRIGITRAVDLSWRYGLAGSRFLSRGFPDRRV